MLQYEKENQKYLSQTAETNNRFIKCKTDNFIRNKYQPCKAKH